MRCAFRPSRLATLCVSLFLSYRVHGEAAGEKAPQRIDPAGISGHLLLCEAGRDNHESFGHFLTMVGAKSKVLILELDFTAEDQSPLSRLQGEAEKRQVQVAGLRLKRGGGSNEKAIQDAFAGVTGVWLVSCPCAAACEGLGEGPLARACQALLKKRGVVAVSGSATPALGQKVLEGNPQALKGLNWLPGAIIEDHRLGQKNGDGIAKVLQGSGLVGYRLGTGATLAISGRQVRTLGAAKVSIFLPPAGKKPMREIVLEGKRVEDLTALRRAALARSHGQFSTKPAAPVVEKGTLVIVGGGGTPAGLYSRFVELAGGAGKASVVILPTANPDPLPSSDGLANLFRKAGAKKVTVLPGRTLAEVESPAYLDALGEATGIWFGGGRQWRFVDAYEGTKAHALMFAVLRRGGVIGGTSAGASIQAEYMCRGSPLGNLEIAYEGYERGLGFLPGVAVDQHFTQRKRLADMSSLMKAYPQFLGIGIDEATAIIVQGQVAEVIGRGKVHFYDAARKVEKGQPDFVALPSGNRYDLKERRVLANE